MIRSVSYCGSAAKRYGTSGGSTRSSRGCSTPFTYVSCPRIGTAASRAARTKPIRSQISRVRGWIPTAFAYGSLAGSRSTMRQAIPRRRSSAAAVSPTGPAPATSTSAAAPSVCTIGASRAVPRTDPLHGGPQARSRRSVRRPERAVNAASAPPEVPPWAVSFGSRLARGAWHRGLNRRDPKETA